MISYKEYLRQYGKDDIVEELIPHDQAFRRYTEALMTWLKDKKFKVLRDNKTIDATVLYSFPSMSHALKGAGNYLPHGQYQKDLKDKVADLREDRSPIPVISFYLADLSLSWERQLPGDVRFGGSLANGAKGHAYRLQKDRPYDLVYTFSLWTRYKADMNYMWQQFLEPFDPVLYFDVDRQSIPMKIDNIADNSQLESVDGSEQLVRWDVTCSMEGWLRANIAKVPTVQKQRIAFAESTHEGSIDDAMKISTDFNLDTGEIKNESVD